MKKIAAIYILGIVLAFAQTTEYPHVQDNGGGYRTDGTYRSYASIGQAVIGNCGNGTYINQVGYLTSTEVYLAIEEKPNSDNLPDKLVITPPYPNPFNSACQVDLNLPEGEEIKFAIYDLFGRKIFEQTEYKPAGIYTLKFEAGSIPSGIYIYRVSIGNTSDSGKLILVR